VFEEIIFFALTFFEYVFISHVRLLATLDGYWQIIHSPNNYQFYENCCIFSVFLLTAAMLLCFIGGKGKHDIIRAFRNHYE